MGLLTDNPVLIKEVRGRLRARRQTRKGRIGAFIAVGSIIALLYYFGISSMFGLNSSSNAEGLFSFYVMGLELTAVVFMSPALAAASITQEREQQTWNALLMSRLTSGEIVTGKFISAMLPTLIIIGAFFPMNLLAAFTGGVSFGRFLMVHLLLILTIMFITAVSLSWSWASRRTYIATAAAFASVAFLVIGTWILYALSENITHSSPEYFIPLWINPYVAMGDALDRGLTYTLTGSINLTYISIFCCIVYLTGTAALLWFVTRRLTRGPKELEQ